VHKSRCAVGALRAENAALRSRTNALEDGLAALQAEMRAVRGALGPWAPRTEPAVPEARVDELAGFFAGAAADGFYAVREPGIAPSPGPPTPFAPTPGAPFAAGVAPLDLGAPLAGTLAGLRASVVGVAAGALAQAADVGALRLALGGVRAQVHSLLADRNARARRRARAAARRRPRPARARGDEAVAVPVRFIKIQSRQFLCFVYYTLASPFFCHRTTQVQHSDNSVLLI
jgi:hypothetical protein